MMWTKRLFNIISWWTDKLLNKSLCVFCVAPETITGHFYWHILVLNSSYFANLNYETCSKFHKWTSLALITKSHWYLKKKKKHTAASQTFWASPLRYLKKHSEGKFSLTVWLLCRLIVILWAKVIISILLFQSLLKCTKKDWRGERMDERERRGTRAEGLSAFRRHNGGFLCSCFSGLSGSQTEIKHGSDSGRCCFLRGEILLWKLPCEKLAIY